jgi:hypothetical protein
MDQQDSLEFEQQFMREDHEEIADLAFFNDFEDELQ